MPFPLLICRHKGTSCPGAIGHSSNSEQMPLPPLPFAPQPSCSGNTSSHSSPRTAVPAHAQNYHGNGELRPSKRLCGASPSPPNSLSCPGTLLHDACAGQAQASLQHQAAQQSRLHTVSAACVLQPVSSDAAATNGRQQLPLDRLPSITTSAAAAAGTHSVQPAVMSGEQGGILEAGTHQPYHRSGQPQEKHDMVSAQQLLPLLMLAWLLNEM